MWWSGRGWGDWFFIFIILVLLIKLIRFCHNYILVADKYLEFRGASKWVYREELGFWFNIYFYVIYSLFGRHWRLLVLLRPRWRLRRVLRHALCAQLHVLVRAVGCILILFILLKMHERRFLHEHGLHANERRYLFFSRAAAVLEPGLAAQCLVFGRCRPLRRRIRLIIRALSLRGHLHLLIGLAVNIEEALRLLEAGHGVLLDGTTRRIGWWSRWQQHLGRWCLALSLTLHLLLALHVLVLDLKTVASVGLVGRVELLDEDGLEGVVGEEEGHWYLLVLRIFLDGSTISKVQRRAADWNN